MRNRSLNKWAISNKIEILSKYLKIQTCLQCLQYAFSLVCDVINFICNLKLFKAINRNYFDIGDSLIAIPWSINYAAT